MLAMVKAPVIPRRLAGDLHDDLLFFARRA